jgi:hypothetical protein
LLSEATGGFVMPYLNVSPTISALRESAQDFEMDRGWLHHYPSHHRFKIRKNGKVTLRADCDCCYLQVGQQQGVELLQAFNAWHEAYWRPIEINREFASHFATPSLGGKVMRMVARMLHRVLHEYGPIDEGGRHPSMTPAE